MHELVAIEAKKLIGTPFAHCGRGERALDCIGLLVTAHQRAGFDVEDCLTYSAKPNPKQLIRNIEPQCERIDVPEVGAFGLFWLHEQMRPSLPHHVAIFVEPDAPYEGSGIWMVHALNMRRVSTNPYSGIWPKQTHSIWRWRQ